MHSPASIFLWVGLVPSAFAGYSLKDVYSTDRFFDMFNFDTVNLLGNETTTVLT